MQNNQDQLNTSINQPKKHNWLLLIFKIFLTLFALIILISCFFLAGPFFGKVVDAKTGKPISNIEIKYTVKALSIDIQGGSTYTIYNKSVKTKENGRFTFPFKIIFKNPLFLIDSQSYNVNKLDKYTVIYQGSSHSKNGRVNFAGASSGYESLGFRKGWIPFSNKTITLVPLVDSMVATDCTENMLDVDQKRCFDHLAQREAQPIRAAADYRQYTFVENIIKDYYNAKYFDKCDEPEDSYMFEESRCEKVFEAVEKNEHICVLIPDIIKSYCKDLKKFSNDRSIMQCDDPAFNSIKSDTEPIQSACNKYHIGSVNRNKKPPLVPFIIKDKDVCNKFEDELLKLCLYNYENRGTRSDYYSF
ncbi:hypothetical protein ACFL14_00110 [Patescibacteria group bacterium]